MKTRFVCLANSFKEGGRCLAGIELDNKNNPKIEIGHPKWIRPICDTPHGEVPTYLVAHLEILDIVQIDIIGYPDERDYQSENVLFDQNSLNVMISMVLAFYILPVTLSLQKNVYMIF